MNWFTLFKKRVTPKRLIFIDIGYHSHHLSKALIETGGYQVVAYIDEEPWNHLNLMNGGKIHYPSELLALAEKNRIDSVIKFNGEGWQPDRKCLTALNSMRVSYLSIDPHMGIAEQLDLVARSHH